MVSASRLHRGGCEFESRRDQSRDFVEALAGSPLQHWDRQGESAWPLPTDFRFGNGPSDPTRLEGADLAIARDADGSAHVPVVTGAPPRLLVYRWTPGRGLALRIVRAVGADLVLDRVP